MLLCSYAFIYYILIYYILIYYILYYPYQQYTNVIYLPVTWTPQLQSTKSRVRIAITNFPKVIRDCMFRFLLVVRQICNRILSDCNCEYKCHFVNEIDRQLMANLYIFPRVGRNDLHVIYIYIYMYMYIFVEVQIDKLGVDNPV